MWSILRALYSPIETDRLKRILKGRASHGSDTSVSIKNHHLSGNSQNATPYFMPRQRGLCASRSWNWRTTSPKVSQSLRYFALGLRIDTSHHLRARARSTFRLLDIKLDWRTTRPIRGDQGNLSRGSDRNRVSYKQLHKIYICSTSPAPRQGSSFHIPWVIDTYPARRFITEIFCPAIKVLNCQTRFAYSRKIIKQFTHYNLYWPPSSRQLRYFSFEPQSLL